ncbi:hypothetical protein GcM3_156016, partial [Golovinomyces cichoracearum]
NPEAKRYLVSQLSRNSSIEVTQRDIYNISQSLRNLKLQGKTALQWVVEFLEKGPFLFRLDTDENNQLTHLYLSPEENIEIWKENPNILLADATYKINRFNQPMINICGSAGNSMTPQLVLLIKYNIPFPTVWVTDRELALMKAIEAIFSTSDHILCRWHVNMNVVARCKKCFKVQKEWDAFYTTWIKLIDSTTLEDVRKNFEVLCKHNNVAVKYIEKTWMIWKEKIFTYW